MSTTETTTSDRQHAEQAVADRQAEVDALLAEIEHAESQAISMARQNQIGKLYALLRHGRELLTAARERLCMLEGR
jgi:hypothetical protein